MPLALTQAPSKKATYYSVDQKLKTKKGKFKMNSKDTIQLRSTGTCFDDAVSILTDDTVIPKEKAKDALIAHGLVSKRKNKKELGIYAHAWVAFDNRRLELAYDDLNELCCIGYTIPEFETIYRIHDVTHYTIDQLLIEGLQSPAQNTGPFKLKYLKKCNDWGQVKHLFKTS